MLILKPYGIMKKLLTGQLTGIIHGIQDSL